jgi:hypothetical protein
MKKLIFIILSIFLSVGYVHAASTERLELFSVVGMDADVGVNDVEWVCLGLDSRADDFVFEVVAERQSGAGTLDVSVVTSGDRVHMSDAIIEFTQIDGDLSEYRTLAVRVYVMRCLGVLVDLVGTAEYDLSVNVYFRRRQ